MIKSRDLIVGITGKAEVIKRRRFTEGSDEGFEVPGDLEIQTFCTYGRHVTQRERMTKGMK